LAWAAPLDNTFPIDKYAVKVDEFEQIASQTSIIVSNLKPGTTYQVCVRARNIFGSWSAYSAVVAITTDAARPPNPTNIKAKNKSQTGFTLGWDAPEAQLAVTEFKIQLHPVRSAYGSSVDLGSQLEVEKLSGTNSIVITDLKGGMKYEARVKAKNASGWSDYTTCIVRTAPKGGWSSDMSAVAPKKFKMPSKKAKAKAKHVGRRSIVDTMLHFRTNG
jgi:hypothetical protein